MPSITIDTRGLRCPLPMLKVQKAIRSIEPGSSIMVLATDPGIEVDMQAFCALNGHTLAEIVRQNDGFICALIVKSARMAQL